MATAPRHHPVPVRVLGPIAVGTGGPPLRRQSRMVLGWVTLHRQEPISLERLTQLLWPNPPASARRQLQTLVRQDLAELVVLEGPRARLDASALDLDEDRFHALTATRSAPEALEEALGLWKGQRPYLEIADHPDALAAVHSLELERLRVLARLHQGRMQRGDEARVVADLAAELAVQPDATGLRRLHALALALTGRRIEALRELQLVRQALGRPDPWTRAADEAVQLDDAAALRGLVDELAP